MKRGGAIRFEAYDELSYCTREKKRMQRKGNGRHSRLLSATCRSYHCSRTVHNTAIPLR